MSDIFKFRSKIWKYKGKSGWHFVTLPKKLSRAIRKQYGKSEEGWGRLNVNAQVVKTSWQTAIWYDTKAESYLLPVKSDIRRKEGLKADDSITVSLRFKPVKIQKKVSLLKPTMWG